MNPLQELLDGVPVTLDSQRVREATAAALHVLRHDRRLERLDFDETHALTRLLNQTADIRTLARYALPWRPKMLEKEIEDMRAYLGGMLFEVVDEAALEDEAIRRLQRVAVAAGSQTRLAAVPFRVHIYNRRFALVATDFDDSTAGAIAVREPGLVVSFTELHARMWQQGRKWDGAGVASVDLADVLAELLQGSTDEVSAQRLHVSLRTYRRKVQELLQLLGTSSRFQAGAVAEQRRYLDLVRPVDRPLAATPDPYLEALSQVRSSSG